MKFVIPGGSGQVGTMLCRKLVADGHDVVVLSRAVTDGKSREKSGVRRRSRKTKPVGPPLQLREEGHGQWRVLKWDGRHRGDWIKELEDADAVINLAGRSVNCRYTPKNRKAIMDSRLESTRVIGKAISRARRPPRVWLQASTATIYSHRYDAPNDEHVGVVGGQEPDAPGTWVFSIDVAKSWEQAATEWVTPHTRKVLMRSAIVMQPDPGGAFDIILGMVRRGLGGKNGDGKQYVSWVHEHDFVRAIYWLVEHDDLTGPVNIASPNPLPNAQFMRDLRKAWGIRIGLPSPKWLLEIATFFMRTETELILKSRRVVPTRLLDSGFTFEYPTWPEAAVNLCRRWREVTGA